ncbi:hypothetical protein K4A83_20155 [Spirulina subsalsa FACHB-351]|uniref:Uncharacterized protein n=1 Tax=Spirulina subsalsa FACHB-351 TaxID=234711 RepID=A0ABT3LAQ1_9CYAN|nr:hypothetical protein [Spirulina subsalsa]MCW6038568.1 hypothetical protein [Spirulina subsalsa FACHB-351]
MNRLYCVDYCSISLTTTPDPQRGLGIDWAIDWGRRKGLQVSREWPAGDLVLESLSDTPLDAIAGFDDRLAPIHGSLIPRGIFNGKPKPRSGRDRSKPVPQ